MRISASKLRENIYNILDQTLQTGVPVPHHDVRVEVGHLGLLTQQAKDQIEKDDLLLSPALLLELEYLNEIDRLKAPAQKVIGALSDEIGVSIRR